MRFASLCVLALVLAACGASDPCDGGRSATLGGASACVYEGAIVVEGGFRCPASFPVRWDLEEATICGPGGFEPRDVTDDECAAEGLRCVPSTSGACDGPQPAIDECTTGATWAECGGSDPEPIFACRRADGQCYWFEGGCVAIGFEATRCPAEDVCCLASGPGGYPYGSSWRDPEWMDASVYDFLYGWGIDPWDRRRERAVEVSIDALEPATASLTCTGLDSGSGSPCGRVDAELYVGHTLRGALTIAVGSTAGTLGGWRLWIDIVRDEDDSLHARACRVHFTDGVDYTCQPEDQHACATSGTLTIPAFPTTGAEAASMPLSLSATFADGASIDLRL